MASTRFDPRCTPLGVAAQFEQRSGDLARSETIPRSDKVPRSYAIPNHGEDEATNIHLPAGQHHQLVIRPSRHTSSAEPPHIDSYRAKERELYEAARDIHRSLPIFLSHSLNDFLSLSQNFEDDRKISDIDPQSVVQLAARAFSLGEDEFARRCVERAVLLHKLGQTSHHDFQKSLELLRQDNSLALREHFANIDRLSSHLKQCDEEDFDLRLKERFSRLRTPLSTQSSPPLLDRYAQGESLSSESSLSTQPSTALARQGETVSRLDKTMLDFILMPSKFFVTGRVFAIFWHEPLGVTPPDKPRIRRGAVGPGFSTIMKEGPAIFSHVRRFVVVKSFPGHSICLPTSTYGGKGLARKNLSQQQVQAHAILYNEGQVPMLLPNEQKLTKAPIAVRLESEIGRIDRASRLDFSRPHTVQHNLKVTNVGMVVSGDIEHLVSCFINTMST